MNTFDYSTAFSRNIGWVTESEQRSLSQARIAIGGLGGVGGIHLLTLARLGIGCFNLADFDVFDIVNFNRQAGATVRTIGCHKLDVMCDMALDINPSIELRRFPSGIEATTVDSFLDDVDVYVDGLDFFAFGARRATFAACQRKGIPAVTVAPLGMGAALLVFGPDGMSFDDYFGIENGEDEVEMAIRFLVGLSPAMLHRGYVADYSRIDFAKRQGPSSVAACQLCAGIAATEVLKLLLGRKGVRFAPWGSQFDAYTMRYTRTWRPGGFRNPLQVLTRTLVRMQIHSHQR